MEDCIFPSVPPSLVSGIQKLFLFFSLVSWRCSPTWPPQLGYCRATTCVITDLRENLHVPVVVDSSVINTLVCSPFAPENST